MVHHRGTEDTEATENSLTRLVIGTAIQVHRNIGPGLLESVYQECLAEELEHSGIGFVAQRTVPLFYRQKLLRSSLRVDFLVEQKLILEIKSIESIAHIHTAQLLTYLRLSGLRLGLLINFNTVSLRSGIRRVING